MLAGRLILRQSMAFRIDVAHDIAACAATVPIQEEVWSGDVIVPPQLMLAAYTRESHRDFYGAMPDKLNAGLPSDRIYVEWPIGHDRTYKRLKGEDHPPTLEGAEAEGIRYLLTSERGDRPGALNAGRTD